MKWTQIKYDSNVRWELQNTLPEVNKPIICCSDGKKVFDLKISKLRIDPNRFAVSIDAMLDIDGIWWAYLDVDGLPIEVQNNIFNEGCKDCTLFYTENCQKVNVNHQEN